MQLAPSRANHIARAGKALESVKSDIAIPSDYSCRIKSIRERLGLTQAQLAQRISVSFATVNRWENGQTKPARLAWRQVVNLESTIEQGGPKPEASLDASAPPSIDFTSRPTVVTAVAEAMRLSYGHLANPAFATEVSLIDPLPHQRIAVYERMLNLSPLRFLLADDAGAGKTIMTGLYLREVLARRLIKRVLVVPPAGLVGNWEREMRTLFALRFRIVRGTDARDANPFSESESDRVIVSLDTLVGDRMFSRLREAVALGGAPYDLVVFDEAHKLAAHQQRDYSIRKTKRYHLAAALAGLPADQPRWDLGWSATHVLLLTATPHMGKDFPYFSLWRLLAPDVLTTFDAFKDFPESQRRRHFIRRTKEEMVTFEGQALYPQRRCDTISYLLNESEQALYEATTRYISQIYNQAQILNRSAARLAMTVFQRRQASSTYALMRSFERRLVRLDEAIELVRSGHMDELESGQTRLGDVPDFFETYTADEDIDESNAKEGHEEFEEQALAGIVAPNLAQLRDERTEVEALIFLARQLVDKAEDSKFEKLREVLSHPEFATEKFIIFSEHRDTAEFLVRRLEGLGFTGQVALIHGGLGYLEREAQVDLFRRPLNKGGADYLVATDAAGEGINLQFCWLMVNYDVPWNPARLEQRMGRIHRYGQQHDPVVIVNLVAGETREGRVLKTLLDKLELIRKRLNSDKVFDVVGRLFQSVSLKDYMVQAVTDEGAAAGIKGIEGLLTEQQARALEERDRARYGGGDVRSRLPAMRKAIKEEPYRQLMPGYVRRFLTASAPLVGLRMEGDSDAVFQLAQEHPHGLNPVLSAIEVYPAATDGGLTFYRPTSRSDVIWLHPGEPVFDRFCNVLLSRCKNEARRGAVFLDPHVDTPYLFHLARVSVVRNQPPPQSTSLAVVDKLAHDVKPEILESRLIGIRQGGDGSISPCPLEHLLLLRGALDVAPGGVPLARRADSLTDAAREWVSKDALARLVDEHRRRIEESLPERLAWLARGCDHRTAELIARRKRVRHRAHLGDANAVAELARVKSEQRRLAADKERRLGLIRLESSLVVAGDSEMVAHALVLPTHDREDKDHHTAQVEKIAVILARAHEEASGATVQDVSRPELARQAGLSDWPGFDLLSVRPAGSRRNIEVKGLAGTGDIKLSENEWTKACNLRESYWLYAVYDCATPKPRLVRVRDPFAKLLAKGQEFSAYAVAASSIYAAAEAGQGSEQ